MAIHQCACFCNNPRLVHERAVRRITKYLARTPTHTDLPVGNIQVYTCRVVYRPNKEKHISDWAQLDANNS